MGRRQGVTDELAEEGQCILRKLAGEGQGVTVELAEEGQGLSGKLAVEGAGCDMYDSCGREVYI